MRKRNLLFLILSSIMIVPTFVLAKEDVYYTNKNGVNLTQKEYDFISNMYWEGYQEFLTQEMYNDLKSDDIFSQPIEKKSIEFKPKTRGTVIQDSARTLSITKSCSDNCLIVTLYEWKGEPTYKGYDVMGAYFEGTTLQNNPFTVVASSVEQSFCTNYKKETNGLGCSFKVVAGNDAQITQSFRVSKGGHVYASYQHAMQTAFLSESQDYTFSYFGYGNVFLFSEKVRHLYDEMNGVDIDV